MKRNKLGFTLIEIMVVVVIIGLLASIVAPGLMKALDKTKDTRLESDMAAIQSALKMYKLEHFTYPDSNQGLEILISQDRHKQDQGYLPKIPLDPWERPYIYQSPGEEYPYEIYSLGADGLRGGMGENKDIYHWMY